MQSYSGIFGVLHFITTWVMRLSVINVIWFIINLPVFLVVASVMMNFSTSADIIYLSPLLIFGPLLFFPSTTALFAMARDWMVDKDHSSLVKSYLFYVKSNYKKSSMAGFIWVLIWMIWAVDLYFFIGVNSLMGTVILMIGMLLFVTTIHFFSLSVHYHMTIRQLLKNSLMMTGGRPLLTVGTGLLGLFIIYISMDIWFLLIFFTGSLIACLSFYLFYRSYIKIRNS
ncbi:YesL family protein [Halobacillus sp. Marseille-Q1614]|uniref:YesL family protein n=1 Tax=Halobacillus sp. Marseille-Q1614 TaxID=2709134 RepID=UPI001570FBBD|nr:DUF624 domain-containing protein [Halobacillus sp. Marseille-Q1614]